jgi:hypothetical protein
MAAPLSACLGGIDAVKPQINTDKKRMKKRKTEAMACKPPELGNEIVHGHCQRISRSFAFSSSVFSCVHLWFQRFSS